MCNADNDLEWPSSHDPRDVDDISNAGIATVELDQDICCVCCERAQQGDWKTISILWLSNIFTVSKTYS